MCTIFSDADFSGVLANAEITFKHGRPVLYNFLKNRKFKCRICEREFTDFFEHFAEHMKELSIETITLWYYTVCLDYIQVIEEV